jgi:hypothetical protein
VRLKDGRVRTFDGLQLMWDGGERKDVLMVWMVGERYPVRFRDVEEWIK